MVPIRLGVIGAGLIWLRRHQPTLATLQDAFTPVAFADPSEQRRNQAAEAFPDAVIVSDYQELLALPQVDAVLVLTPIVLNAPVALAALQAGKDVIMEKPIARSVAEAAHLLTKAKEAGQAGFMCWSRWAIAVPRKFWRRRLPLAKSATLSCGSAWSIWKGTRRKGR